MVEGTGTGRRREPHGIDQEIPRMNDAQASALTKQAAESGAVAAARMQAILVGSTVDAAIAAIRAVAPDQGRGAGEAVADLSDVRVALAEEFNATESRIVVDMAAWMVDGIKAGFVAEVEAQNEALPDALDIVTTPDELDALVAYPVQGNTAQETSIHNARVWRFGADAAVGKAASFGDATVLPATLVELANRTSSVCGRAVEESFVAGQGAARRAVAAALQRAIG
jgi:hypothetical protein